MACSRPTIPTVPWVHHCLDQMLWKDPLRRALSEGGCDITALLSPPQSVNCTHRVFLILLALVSLNSAYTLVMSSIVKLCPVTPF